ncbi:hypothetical protein PF005_g8738 [Phytophthora fragariae]|uniref:Secreted protein n=2 Tax=Phytophthora TaxID=4783 RepID=A0A6A4DVX9_9STRA|nr:hypothetical protein PF003_g15674 [Phytophthora fragariae]KAE9037736.1 hypothetical protein PR002_g6393 [Phytophthora rubi]KAE8940517.1 hypothetical protein PF009_g9676 [Phytophthora fragariae]KAE9015251.1 hypothetical protein PF011_g7715 [Phytophthora fragariae]KAE9045234.1 hypothetical protein PR001_g5060 [Phytophthora rubi]
MCLHKLVSLRLIAVTTVEGWVVARHNIFVMLRMHEIVHLLRLLRSRSICTWHTVYSVS